MKKLLSVLLAAMMLLGCFTIFTACGPASLEEVDGNEYLMNSDGKTYTFRKYKAAETKFTIPTTITKWECAVTKIDTYAFQSNTTIEEVIIPEGIVAVNGFRFCSNLKSVKIPSTAVEVTGFMDCSSLESIVIPEGVTTIGAEAFCNCTSLKSATIPSTVTSVGASAFQNCPALEKITFGGTVELWESFGEPVGATCAIYCADGTIPAQS